MLSAVLGEVKGLVDKRFLLGSFFPVLVAVATGDLLFAAAHDGLSGQIDAWDGYSGIVQAVIAGGVLSAVVLVGAALSSCSILITQLYEGYVGPDWLKRAGVHRQTKRKAATTGNRELRFPFGTLWPTALGNVLRAAEEWPELAYGVNVVVVWPRLFLVLPPDLVSSMTGPSDTIQFLLTVSLLATALAVLGATYAAVQSLGVGTYFVVLLGGLVVARLSYRGAVEAAIDYGLHLRGAFDLHRNELLAQLNLAAPSSQDEELRIWRDVTTRLVDPEPRPVHYVAAPAK
jgi:hypothetical protein